MASKVTKGRFKAGSKAGKRNVKNTPERRERAAQLRASRRQSRTGVPF